MCRMCFERLLHCFPQASSDERMFILWNMTAFPAGDAPHIAKQLTDLSRKSRAMKNGWRPRLWAEAERQEKEMFQIMSEMSDEEFDPHPEVQS